MLSLRGINRSWGKFSLKDIDLSLKAGEYFFLLGPCGAGKTLLLEAVCGVWQLDGGSVLLGEEDITVLSPEKRNIGLIYQEPSLFPHMSIEENIYYGLNARRVKIDNRKKKALDFIRDILNLEGLIGLKDPNILSGGERQILSVVRTLFSFPSVLLLDEPFHSLDYKFQNYLTRILKVLNEDLKLTVVHVTHNLQEAEGLSSRTGFISDGRLLKTGTFAEVKTFLKDYYGI